MSPSTLSLKRFPEYANSTPGQFLFDSKIVCFSLELPWKNNETGISCIPKGIYNIAYTKSAKFQRVLLEIKNVPDREGVRIHSANYSYELEGCIAPATSIKFIGNGKLMGTTSVNALKVLDNVIKKYKLTTLEIL